MANPATASMASGENVAELVAWYNSQRPVSMDIVGDFAGKELFAVQGEALMLHCISAAKVDFYGGFQLLHAVYAVETFLSNLRERGCNFHVVWFKAYENLVVPCSVPREKAYKYLLTRAVLIQHLGRHCNGRRGEPERRICFEFPAISSRDFHAYISQNAVRFFLCYREPSYQSHTNASQHLGIMYSLSIRGYSICLINNLIFRSSKVYAPIVSPSPRSKPLTFNEQVRQEKGLSHSLSQVVQEFKSAFTSWHLNGELLSGREAIAVIILSNILLKDSSTGMKRFVAALLVHMVFLKHCSLSQRSCSETRLSPKDDNNLDKFLHDFSMTAMEIIDHWSETNPLSELQWDIFDLVDGRLLRQTLANLSNVHSDKDLVQEIVDLAKCVTQLTGVSISELLPRDINTPFTPIERPSPPNIETTTRPYLVLPFNHPILNDFLADVRLEIDGLSDPAPTAESLKVFQEVSHWHNAERPIDPKRVPRPKGFLARKKNQRLMADTIAYSASLTNSTGKQINPEIIVVKSHPNRDCDIGSSRADWREDLRKIQAAKNIKNKKLQPMSGRDKALETAHARQTKKLDDKSNAVSAYFKSRCRGLQREEDLIKRYLKTLKLFSSLSETDVITIGAEVSLYMCNTLALIWRKSLEGSGIDSLDIAALLWSRLLETSKMKLSHEGLVEVEKLTNGLGLPKIKHGNNPTPGQCLSIFKELAKSTEGLSLPIDVIDFELENCGPYLDRGFDSQPDSRVPFEPDAWQRKVLDAIDMNKSLFVVAPTSAGKTFISFYAMKKILQANDDDVLVYVAPTKALVNQIAAEIQARFSKTFSHDGRSVWAVHTRDYRINNPNGCQILVTVPHILQIMLLAPSSSDNAKSWAHRVKRIIFDEVHCIGQAEDGVIWEQLLLLAPCPIIALSATVGNPLEFKAWLEGTQKANGFDLEMIVHSSRYSDLRKYLYKPPAEFIFKGIHRTDRLPIPGIESSGEMSRFCSIHPIASIVNRLDFLHSYLIYLCFEPDPRYSSQGIPDDISLEPRDCLTLWRCMTKHQTKEYPIDKSLSPQNFPEIVKKTDIHGWESDLKAALQSWILDLNSPFPSVQKELQMSVKRFHDNIGDLPESQTHNAAFGGKRKTGGILTSILPLLLDLHSHGALPVLMFNYDREKCEKVIFTILEELFLNEKDWKKSSSEWAQKLADYEEWKRTESILRLKKDKAKKDKARKAPKRKDQDDDTPTKEPTKLPTKLEMAREEASKEISIWESFNPAAPVEMFSFADKTKFSNTELEDTLASLKDENIKEKLIDAIRRGLGVHHAGMNRKYRQIVEMLFRKGYLTVVIATGTLALGINMPCKTVVFVGDSVFLTALNYHQASGRAGRRGFDLLGNVVFHHIPPQRVYEIMSSKLPDLSGHFPVSTTLVLRILALLRHTNNSDYAVKVATSMFSQTRLYLGGKASKMAIKHHVRFSIEYLRRQHLLSRDGSPLNFSGLVGHLYFTENAVFAFHALLKEGYFHEVCANLYSKPQDVLETLILVLSHLFCRIPCHRHKEKEWLENVVHNSPSKVLLPKLPARAEAILRAHNKAALDILQAYVGTYIQQHLSGSPDRELPFTRYLVGPELPASIGATTLNLLPPTIIRSQFAALSGFTDDFSSIRELCSTVRGGVFLEESAVPYTRQFPDDTDGVPFNAYIYDFFRHGSQEALKTGNGIRGGDVWFRLKEFSLILATIVTSLANFLDPGTGDNDVEMINDQDGEGNLAESEFGDEALPDQAAGSKIAASTPTRVKRQKGHQQKRAVESWDDDESGSGEDVLGDEDESGGGEDVVEGTAPRETVQPATPAWEGDGGTSLRQVHRAFKELQQAFEEKFRKFWA